MKNKIIILVLFAITLESLASPVLDALKRRTNRAIAIAAREDKKKTKTSTWQMYSNIVSTATNTIQLRGVVTNLPVGAWEKSVPTK